MPFISHLIGGAVGSSILSAGAIMVAAFILEDTTTIIVGVLAADHIIGIPLAISSLYTGIVVGDIGLYCIGFLARSHPKLDRHVDHNLIAPLRSWLENKYVLTIFSARFIPGSRMPTFIASGFFRSSLSTFVLTSVAAVSVWTTILFSASYLFGNLTSQWLGPVRWGIAAAVLLLFFLIARHNFLAYRAQKSASISSGYF